MKRRRLVAGLGAVILGRHLPAVAQRVPFIGFLNSGFPNERAHLVEAFRRGLKEGGYTDGKDVAIEYRWGEGSPDRLPQLAAELVKRNVAVIVGTGGMQPALVAKSATTTIPIVFTGGGDPVKLGLVASLGRPGANVTGVTNISTSLQAKRLEVLHELLPRVASIAYLVNPQALDAEQSVKEVRTAAEARALKIEVIKASRETELNGAFEAAKRSRVGAMLVGDLFVTWRRQVTELAARDALPAAYSFRDYTLAGGLMSYGPDLADGYRQAGLYTARILKGAKPADLPVVQTAKVELVLNLKTAKALGLTISRDFLARVDEVIQ